MAHMVMAVERLVRRDEGQDLIEYGLLAALIAIVAMVGVSTLGDTIYNTLWRAIGQAL